MCLSIILSPASPHRGNPDPEFNNYLSFALGKKFDHMYMYA